VRGVAGQQVNLGIAGDDRSWAALGVGWPSPDRVATQSEAVVVPGGLASFEFRIQAPAAPGDYVLRLRPVVDGVSWLEDQGVFIQLTVQP
jgi:hypothetical protein